MRTEALKYEVGGWLFIHFLGLAVLAFLTHLAHLLNGAMRACTPHWPLLDERSMHSDWAATAVVPK